MNKVILMGRLTRDPNVRYSPRNNSQEEMAIARYTLAVDRRGAKDGQQSADFISCVAFGRDGGISAKEALTAFESIYRLRRQEKSNNWRKYHGLPLKRSKGGKRRGDRKRNDSNSENTGIS